MTRILGRWLVLGSLVTVAAGMSGAIVAPKAFAKPTSTVSPFAGTYGAMIEGYPWAVTVSASGGLTGSLLYGGTGSLRGTVSANGALSLTARARIATYDPCPDICIGDPTRFVSVRWSLSATVSSDASGNLVGTTSTGSSLVWEKW